MSFDLHKPITRRSILAAIGSLFLGQPRAAGEALFQPIELTEGIEIRDVRIYPTPDILRFIAEVHNNSDNIVDTPSVGLILPHMDKGEGFAWATPFASVLHPHTSGGLLGVAPLGLTDDSEWGTPEWMLCDALGTTDSAKLTNWNVDISCELEFYPTSLEIRLSATNRGEQATSSDLWLHALHWDQNDRICGSMNMISLAGIEPGMTRERNYWLNEDVLYHNPHPFVLVDSVEGMSVTVSLQPMALQMVPGCPPIMPWNR